MIAAKCAHCGQDAVLKTGCEVYPHRRDLYELFFWVCIPCNARVGCHKKGNVCDGVKSDGTLPLGTAANQELRNARMAIHNEVDRIWQRQKQRGKARKIVYTVLTNYGRIHGFIGANDTYHTGSLSLQQCAMLNTHWSSMKKVIEERIQLELESTSNRSR